jgi:hypothetical protein
MPFGFGPGGAVLEGMPLINAATPAALAAMNVAGLGNGQLAWVNAVRTAAGPGMFVLQPAVSSAPAGGYVIATADDPARQWVWFPIQDQGTVSFYSPEVNLTVPQVVPLFPPLTYRYVLLLAPSLVVTALDGTITTWHTQKVGANVARDDIVAATLQAPLAAPILNVNGQMTGSRTNQNNLDLTALGINWEITVGAVLGTATVFRGRARITFMPVRF